MRDNGQRDPKVLHVSCVSCKIFLTIAGSKGGAGSRFVSLHFRGTITPGPTPCATRDTSEERSFPRNVSSSRPTEIRIKEVRARNWKSPLPPRARFDEGAFRLNVLRGTDDKSESLSRRNHRRREDRERSCRTWRSLCPPRRTPETRYFRTFVPRESLPRDSLRSLFNNRRSPSITRKMSPG